MEQFVRNRMLSILSHNRVTALDIRQQTTMQTTEVQLRSSSSDKTGNNRKENTVSVPDSSGMVTEWSFDKFGVDIRSKIDL